MRRSNRNQKPTSSGGDGLFLLGLGLVALLLLSDEAESKPVGDIPIQCFTEEQIREKELNIRHMISEQYQLGLQDGGVQAIDTFMNFAKSHCSNPAAVGITFENGAQLLCPKEESTEEK